MTTEYLNSTPRGCQTCRLPTATAAAKSAIDQRRFLTLTITRDLAERLAPLIADALAANDTIKGYSREEWKAMHE